MSHAAGPPLEADRPAVERHEAETRENLARWQRKPALRKAYGLLYRAIAARLRGIPAGPIVECGSGIGNLKEVIPESLATDLFPEPWLDRTENVYALSFPEGSVAGLVLFDVLHHLEYPGTALREVARVLAPGGRLVVVEPAMGMLGRVVLGLFHKEPLGLGREIRWEAPPGWSASQARYYAAQGNAWRIFRKGEIAAPGGLLRVREVTCSSALPWLLSGGFSGPQLYPLFLFPALERLDRLASRLPSLLATRMLVVLEKDGPGGAAPAPDPASP
jgi:SAM-dependent methyltransferase